MLNDLYKKNSFFAQAINYFTQLGYSNIENSTVQTLDIVNDYTAQQPTEQLNTLPLIIKQYITLCAWNNIKASYTIQLHHPQPVYIYSLCPASGNIIVHSTDKHLHLWNCNTGEKIDTFSEDNYLLAICFNNNGSKFATTSYKNNKSLIKIWNIAPKKILSTFSQDNYVYHLEFLTDTSNDTLTTFIKTDNEKFLQLYNCDHHMKPICLGKIPSIKRSTCCDTYDSYKNYEINVCEDNRSILFFTKKRCPELHLCERAIMNGVQTDASFVYRTNTYSRLTKVEKQIVEEKIIKKNETLISSKKMTMTL